MTTQFGVEDGKLSRYYFSNMSSDPATKEDVEQAERRLEKKLDELKAWMLDREVASIRWFVGTQVTYFIITLGAMYFMLQHP